MYIERVPNRNSPQAVLLRESYREGKKVRKRTLANLSHLPDDQIDALRAVLKGATAVTNLDDAFQVTRSLPHGHVAAVLGTARRLGLPRLIASARTEQRDLALALILARVIDPRSKLATAQGLQDQTARSTLGEELGLRGVSADRLYDAMDWLVNKQSAIEERLAKRHLSDGALVLYDLTSTYFEGRCCSLAKLGYPRDPVKGKLQINIGLLCDRQGRPIAVEVFEGNVADPTSFTFQVTKVRERFGLKDIVFVGDRGMITKARIRNDIEKQEGYGWITSLRAPEIRKLVNEGQLQLNLFDERDLAEIILEETPNERLIVCRNPLLATERSRKREDLLRATEKELGKVVAATQRTRRPLRGKDKIGLRVGRVLGRFKMAKHFAIEIEERSFRYRRKTEKIKQEAALDGIYVVRTSLKPETMPAEDVVRAYKDLSTVERAFRSLKTVDLKLRPIHHHLADRVRAHVFICTLAYYVEWHMRSDLTPLIFDDDDPEGADAKRNSIVAPAQRSDTALAKVATKRNEDGLPVQSFQNLLSDLATLARNTIQPTAPGAQPFAKLTTPTQLQQRTLDLLNVRL